MASVRRTAPSPRPPRLSGIDCIEARRAGISRARRNIFETASAIARVHHNTLLTLQFRENFTHRARADEARAVNALSVRAAAAPGRRPGSGSRNASADRALLTKPRLERPFRRGEGRER